MPDALALRLVEADVRVGEAFTRIPFRYGNACLTAVPIAHVRVVAETAAGARAGGVAADCLPPRWFDKSPDRDFRRNVEDLSAAIRSALAAWLEVSRARALPARDLWREAYGVVHTRCRAAGLNKLTASFGSSLLERATIDAACRLAAVPFHAALRRGVLGVTPGEEVPAAPLDGIWVRHTVGLGDALLAADIAPAARIGDGLPESLEEAIAAYGLRYFKIKVQGKLDADLDRLRAIARLLAARCAGGFAVSLDGNEQYRDLAPLEELLARLREDAAGERLVASILFIEQPLAREVALDESARAGVEKLGKVLPIIIDESDDDLDALPRALALGYRGCSIKNCKGVFKAIEFRRSIHERNAAAGAARFFQSGEDLANLAVVPLQQDLTTLTTLGIDHAERNGHHYFDGLAHLPEAERRDALRVHGDLYEGDASGVESRARLRIAGGRLRLASLHAAPGYGYASALALGERTPLDEWSFARLRLDG